MPTDQNRKNPKDLKALAEKLEAMAFNLEPPQGPTPAETRVMVAIRPEKMPILAAGGPDADRNRLQARICRLVYAGSVSSRAPEAADGTQVKVLVRSREMAPWRPGETVTLARSPSHCVALKA